ncbi:hypothetical protein [Gloeobacter morelensis]|uniref:Uncharacterized protein n=1 Tax=Gloeobacter morelensis MG652769 TaxID=2781736 RepID=A0ABY3PM39_9CYAN|nr:hypothetical protein [Gloeobacter morelensis]UFP94755.1 hypothetical protein ISF26_00415 [Gloeobacter morelensis MG652769]
MESVDDNVLCRALSALSGLGLIGLAALGLANAIDLPDRPAAFASPIGRPVIRYPLLPTGNALHPQLFAMSQSTGGGLDAPTAAVVRAHLHNPARQLIQDSQSRCPGRLRLRRPNNSVDTYSQVI